MMKRLMLALGLSVMLAGVLFAQNPVSIAQVGATPVTTTVPVSGSVTTTQATGTNLHAVIDSGSTTAVTGNVTVVQGTGTSLHAVLDTTSTTAVTQGTAANLNATVVGTGTFVSQATLQTQTDTVMVGGVNVKEINAVTPLMGNGATGTGALRVSIANDSTGVVQPGNTANTTPWLVQAVPGTTNGLTPFTVQPGASDNHQVIKNGAGVVYHIVAFNNSATVNYYRLYDAGTGFNGCNSATNLKWSGHIPANTSDAGFIEDIGHGLTFSTGISLCITGAYGQTSTTSATASAIDFNVGYK